MISILQEHFGEMLIHMEINGKPNGVTFRITAGGVVSEFYNQQRHDPDEEKMRLIQTGVKLIGDYIKVVQTTYDMYPSCGDLESQKSSAIQTRSTSSIAHQNLRCCHWPSG